MPVTLLQAFQIAQEIDRQAAARRKKAEQEAKQNEANKKPMPSMKKQPINAIKQYNCIRLKYGRRATIHKDSIDFERR